jgi:hypothetical protein
MADITVGTVNNLAGDYEVILRPVGNYSTTSRHYKYKLLEQEKNLKLKKEVHKIFKTKSERGDVLVANFTDNNNETGSLKGGKRKRTRKAKGTRKVSGYMKYAASRRANIIKEDPSLRSNVVAVAKKSVLNGVLCLKPIKPNIKLKVFYRTPYRRLTNIVELNSFSINFIFPVPPIIYFFTTMVFDHLNKFIFNLF